MFWENMGFCSIFSITTLCKKLFSLFQTQFINKLVWISKEHSPTLLGLICHRAVLTYKILNKSPCLNIKVMHSRPACLNYFEKSQALKSIYLAFFLMIKTLKVKAWASFIQSNLHSVHFWRWENNRKYKKVVCSL